MQRQHGEPGAYRHAHSVGEFPGLRPRPPRVPRNDLGWDLAKQLSGTSRFVPPERSKSARLIEVGVAYAVMTVASAGEPWAPSPAAVYRFTPAAPQRRVGGLFAYAVRIARAA